MVIYNKERYIYLSLPEREGFMAKRGLKKQLVYVCTGTIILEILYSLSKLVMKYKLNINIEGNMDKVISSLIIVAVVYIVTIANNSKIVKGKL